MLKFFCNRSQKPAKGPWQVFLFTTDSRYWLELGFPLFLLITSALHSPQGRTYHRNRALGRLYGITFLPLGRFEEQLCCYENVNENEDLIFMEIAFDPCGRRTRFVGYCFSLDMATALGQRPKGLWSFMFLKPRDDGFYLTQIAVNCPRMTINN